MSRNQVRLTLAAIAALIAIPLSAQEVRRGGENLLHRGQLTYPEEAIANKIEGTVVIEARLDGKGVVRDAKALSGPELLRAAALKSVLDWHYSVEKGVPPIVEIAIEFKLPKHRIAVTNGPVVDGTLKSIDFEAVYGELKEKILAKLALKVGDSIPVELHSQIVQAVRSVDEHLQVRIRATDSNIRIVVSMASPYWAPASAAQPAVPGQIRVGGNVQQANLIQQPRPVYPPDAKQARIQGTVRMQVVIAKDGTVKSLEVESGHPLLVESAMDAVKRWVYKPTLLNGQPVEVLTTVDVNYTLNQ